MRFLSIFTAAVLSSLAIASPLSNADKDNHGVVPRATACNKSHLDIFNDDIKYGIPFCQFYFALPRTRSPIPGLNTQEVYDVCKCLTDGQFQPAARVGDNSPRSSFSVVTRTVRSTVTVARTTVALTTARSVPIRTTGVSTVTEKQIIRTTITARPTDVVKVSTVTIAKSTITIKASGAGNTNGKSTITVAKTTITLKPMAAAKTSTVTIAKTTITAKASGATGSGNGASASKATITVAKSTITVAKSTVTQKSTVTIAKTTITAKNQNASPTTVFKTVTLSAIGSGQKIITIAKSTITVKASNAAQSTATSVRTVTQVKTVGSAQTTVTVARTTITSKASSVTRVSSVAQNTIVSVKTVTSVRTVGAQTTATRVVTSTFYPSIITITNTQTQAGTQAATTATTVITLGSDSGSSSSSDSGSASGTAIASSAGVSTTAAPSSAAASSTSGTAASSTVDPRSTCSMQPSSTPPASVTIADTEYNRFYSGCGFTEDPNNPGNAYYSANFPPVVTRLDSSVSPSDAVQQCAEDAYYRYDDPNQYLSFDLHFISTNSNGTGAAGEGGEGYWECVQYFSEQSDEDDSPYFNVTNSAVTIAYGYSSGLYSDAATAGASNNAKRNVVQSNEVSKSSHFHPEGRGQMPAHSFAASNLTHVAY